MTKKAKTSSGSKKPKKNDGPKRYTGVENIIEAENWPIQLLRALTDFYNPTSRTYKKDGTTHDHKVTQKLRWLVGAALEFIDACREYETETINADSDLLASVTKDRKEEDLDFILRNYPPNVDREEAKEILTAPIVDKEAELRLSNGGTPKNKLEALLKKEIDDPNGQSPHLRAETNGRRERTRSRVALIFDKIIPTVRQKDVNKPGTLMLRNNDDSGRDSALLNSGIPTPMRLWVSIIQALTFGAQLHSVDGPIESTEYSGLNLLSIEQGREALMDLLKTLNMLEFPIPTR